MKYQTIRIQTYRKYKTIKPIFCPYLKAKVLFTSQGFWHMIYRSRNNKRPASTQVLRFKLLTKAAQLLHLTTTLQEYQHTGKTEYFGFIAILDGWKIKVIVKRIGQGKPHFLSVIPNWTTNSKRDRLLHKGNMEED